MVNDKWGKAMYNNILSIIFMIFIFLSLYNFYGMTIVNIYNLSLTIIVCLFFSQSLSLR